MIFVTIEGVDGAGKSTQARRLVNRLEKEGYEAVLFREPGGTPLSDKIRSLLLDAPDLAIAPLPELLLFSAARAQLVKDRIRPALEEGKVVVCDRFYDSTTAYQGAGREIADLDWISSLNARAAGGLRPHRTWLLALPPEEAARRRARRSTPLFKEEESVPPEQALRTRPDRMEQAGQAFYDRVAKAFDDLATAEPDRIARLDGTLREDDLADAIWRDARRLLVGRSGG